MVTGAVYAEWGDHETRPLTDDVVEQTLSDLGD